MLQFSTQSLLPWNEENFGYISTRSGGDVSATIALASRYSLGLKEAAKSYGVYTAQDERITFAMDALAFPPKPRDWITPPTLNARVVISSTPFPFLKYWELIVRDLVIVHDLRDTCRILRPNPTPGDGGLRDGGTFAEVAASVNCKLNWDRTAFEADTAGKFSGRKQYTCHLEDEIETLPGDVIEVGNVKYEVVEAMGFTFDSLTQVRCTRIV